MEKFLSNKMVAFMEPMLFEAAKKRPTDPVEFCIKWLQKYEGICIATQRIRSSETTATVRTRKRIPSKIW